MKIEHFAYQVAEPDVLAQRYREPVMHRTMNVPFQLVTAFAWSMLAWLPAQSAIEKNSPVAQHMSWESSLLGKSISCVVRLPDSNAEENQVVVCPKNLPAQRLVELDDKTLIESVVDQHQKSPAFTEQDEKYEFSSVENLPIQKGLPDPFLMPDGKRVQTLQDWSQQRAYIEAMLEHYLYGTVPPRPEEIEVEQVGSQEFDDGKAVEEKYALTIRRNGNSVTCNFLVVRPASKKRYPSVIKNDRVSFDASPGRSAAPRFDPGLEVAKRGYLLCRFNRVDLAADDRTHSDTREAGRKVGVYPLYPEYDWAASRKKRTLVSPPVFRFCREGRPPTV